MEFQGLNRSDPEKVFISCRNVSNATISAGVPVEMEAATITDGNSVTQCKSAGLAALFVGITDASMVDDAYGLVQVYGFRTSAYASCASGGSAVGTYLIAAGAYLTDTTISAATTSGWNHVALMETSAASAVANYNVFIRAL